MTANPNKDAMKAWQWLEAFLMVDLPKSKQQEVHIYDLVRIATMKHPISEQTLLKRIQNCYVDRGLLEYDNELKILKVIS